MSTPVVNGVFALPALVVRPRPTVIVHRPITLPSVEVVDAHVKQQVKDDLTSFPSLIILPVVVRHGGKTYVKPDPVILK